MTKEQNIAHSFINGNISWVREQLNKDKKLYIGVSDELFDMLEPEQFKRFTQLMSL